MNILICYGSQRGIIDFVRNKGIDELNIMPYLDHKTIRGLSTEDNVIGINLPPNIIEAINDMGATYFNIDFKRHITKKKVSEALTSDQLEEFGPSLIPYSVHSLHC